jgi:hypothetical protein
MEGHKPNQRFQAGSAYVHGRLLLIPPRLIELKPVELQTVETSSKFLLYIFIEIKNIAGYYSCKLLQGYGDNSKRISGSSSAMCKG